MHLDLPPDLEKLISVQVKSGRYPSAGDVIRDALHLMRMRDELQDLQKDEARTKIAAGVASLRAGRGRNGEAVFYAKMASDQG